MEKYIELSSPAVETWDLTKSFKDDTPIGSQDWTDAMGKGVKHLFHPMKKRKTVIDSVNLSIKRGELFGLLGPNGAGKTTFLKLLSCLLYPDGGGGVVNGYDLRRERSAVRNSVAIAKAGGYLGTLWQLTGMENLLFRARMCGISGKEASERVNHVLDRLQIAHKAREHSWNWSAGERQRFNLAMTFIAQTPVVILDEPTSHLDPHISRIVREFVKEDLSRRDGRTVIMSTHYLAEADLLCDRVAILHKGRILACDTPAKLKRIHVPEQMLEVQCVNYTPEIGERIKGKCGVSELLEHFQDVATGQVKLRPKWSGTTRDPDALRRELDAEGVTVTSNKWVDATLDDVYFYLTEAEQDGN